MGEDCTEDHGEGMSGDWGCSGVGCGTVKTGGFSSHIRSIVSPDIGPLICKDSRTFSA